MTERSDGDVHGKQPIFWLVLVIAVFVAAWAMRAAASVVIPVIVAFFVAIAIEPVDGAIRDRLPRGLRWVGHVVSMLILILVLGAFFVGIGLAARQVAEKFPDDFAGVGDMIEGTTAAGDGGGGTADESAAQDPAPGSTNASPESAGGGAGEAEGGNGVLRRLGIDKGELGQFLRERGTSYASVVINGTATFLASLVLILFLALLLLVEAPHWRSKASTVLTRREESQWMQTLERTAHNLRVFVVAKGAIGLVTAVLYVGWMAVMGLDLLLVWGILTFLLSYIPVIGSIVAGGIAAGYAFFQLDLYWAVVTGLGLLAIEQVMGNYVEPRFLGRQLALSSFVVLVSLLAWGWLWGIAGALLATPMLILILNIAAHVGSLRPIAVLLSEHGEESVRAVHAEEQA